MAANDPYRVTKNPASRKNTKPSTVQPALEVAASKASHEAYISAETNASRKQISRKQQKILTLEETSATARMLSGAIQKDRELQDKREAKLKSELKEKRNCSFAGQKEARDMKPEAS